MNTDRLLFAITGFSAAFFLSVPSFKKWLLRKISLQKLKITNEALEQAEERLLRYEERYDRVLDQLSSYFLVNQELLEALRGARDSMDEALEFVVCLRNLQMQIIASYPGAADLSALERLYGDGKRRRERSN